MTKRLGLATILSAAVLFLSVVLLSQSPPSRKLVTFSEDAPGPVLTLTESGGMVAMAVSLKIYASGTAELEYWSGKNLLRSASMPPLSYEEMESLLSTIVDGYLAEYDEAHVRAEVRERYGEDDLLRSSDAGTFSATFRVREYREGASEPVEVVKKVAVPALQWQLAHFPAIREFQALAVLKDRLSASRRTSGEWR